MISADDYLDNNFQTCPADRPLIVQIAGHNPAVMLQAARMVEDKCDAIDINLGCPQGIAKRGRYGAFLMEELELLHEIVSLLSTNLKIPVTCKTRIYQGEDGLERSIKLCETLVNAGAQMLTIHGRTREQKQQATGSCDWERVAEIKKHFGDKVPIIANGGIETIEDVYICLEKTGCDGVMSSEAILENPQLFDTFDRTRSANSRSSCSRSRSETKKIFNQIELAQAYIDLCKQYPPHAFKTIRGHCMKFLFRYFEIHTGLRNKVGETCNVDVLGDVCTELSQLLAANGEAFYPISWYNRHKTLATKHNLSLKDRQAALWDDFKECGAMNDRNGDGDGDGDGKNDDNNDHENTIFSGINLFGDNDDE